MYAKNNIVFVTPKHANRHEFDSSLAKALDVSSVSLNAGRRALFKTPTDDTITAAETYLVRLFELIALGNSVKPKRPSAFVWSDTLSRRESRTPETTTELRGEALCVMVALGAIHMNMGGASLTGKRTSLRAAANHYGHAAAYFTDAIDYKEQLNDPPTALDMCDAYLLILVDLAIGQQLECRYRSMVQRKAGAKALARVCHSIAGRLGDAVLKYNSDTTVRCGHGRDVVSFVALKYGVFFARAASYQAKVERTVVTVVAVADAASRLKYAVTLLSRSIAVGAKVRMGTFGTLQADAGDLLVTITYEQASAAAEFDTCRTGGGLPPAQKIPKIKPATDPKPTIPRPLIHRDRRFLPAWHAVRDLLDTLNSGDTPDPAVVRRVGQHIGAVNSVAWRRLDASHVTLCASLINRLGGVQAQLSRSPTPTPAPMSAAVEALLASDAATGFTRMHASVADHMADLNTISRQLDPTLITSHPPPNLGTGLRRALDLLDGGALYSEISQLSDTAAAVVSLFRAERRLGQSALSDFKHVYREHIHHNTRIDEPQTATARGRVVQITSPCASPVPAG